jgi:predicted secreted hydrolase
MRLACSIVVLLVVGCSEGTSPSRPDGSIIPAVDAETPGDVWGVFDGGHAIDGVDWLDGGTSHRADAPASSVALPTDDRVHSTPAEWWYWTGHLQTATGRWFGFEEVFFRVTAFGQLAKMFHVAVTDIEANQFHYSTNVALGDLPTTPNGFDFTWDASAATGGNGVDHLHGEVDDHVFDLQLSSTKPPVLQHDLGYTAYPWGGYTYYYSRERMAATGTLTIGGAAMPVTGTAWFDHQWGDMSSILSLGWDWFSLQLDDNREIMLFIVRNSGQNALIGGSFTNADGITSQITASDFSITPIGQWTSTRTGCTYPSGWNAVVNGLSFTIIPVIPDQELSTATPIYWEGVCEVTGAARGRAYVELTGYCP